MISCPLKKISSHINNMWGSTISPHCSPPALLACQCNLNKCCLQRKPHIILASQHSFQLFAQQDICVFTQTCYTSSAQSVGARPSKTTTASLCAYKHAHWHYQASTWGLLNTCVSLCVGSAMLSSRIMQALLLRRQRVQPCQHTVTVAMPSVCVSRPIFYGSRLYAKRPYTTHPLCPDEKTMLQALHNKWGHPSIAKFIQVSMDRAQNRVEFSTNFLALHNRFSCKVFFM